MPYDIDMQAALKEAWADGYQTAVDTFKEIAAEQFKDENSKSVLGLIARILEAGKPC